MGTTAARRRITGLAAAMIFSLPIGALAQTPVQVQTHDGSSSISFGVLTQALAQQDVSDAGVPSLDLCLRRFRLIAGGKLANKVKLFVDTDTPYMGQHSAGWSMPATYLQDFILTYEWRPQLMVDGGLLLVPDSYNGTQSAASLMAIGYGAYSFQASAPTHSRVGRDQGVQLRGYLAKNRIEYRAGVFRGAMKVDADLAPRYVGRVVWHPFGAQTSYFYTGTTQGKKRLFGIGASVDRQEHFSVYSADLFSDWPLANGATLTAQADYTRYDGDRTFPSLPRQHTWMAEASYTWRTRVGAFGQVSRQDVVAAGRPDAAVFQGGVLYWMKGHRRNLKAGIGRTMKTGTTSHTQLLVQSQLFIF